MRHLFPSGWSTHLLSPWALRTNRAARAFFVTGFLIFLAPAHGLAQAPENSTTESESDDSWGEEEGWGDADDDLGFQDTTIALDEKLSAPSPWTLKGTRRYDWAAWAERLSNDPLAKGRHSLDLEAYFKYTLDCAGCTLRGKFTGHAEYDLAYAHDREKYDQPTLDTYEWLVQARENYGSFSNGFFELWIGRQIVAWGEGQMMSPLDVVNPRDLREPGVADLEDLRMAVLSTRAAVNRGPHRLELMVVHEKNFGLRTPPLGPFSPLTALMDEGAGAVAAGVSFQELLIDRTLNFEHRTRDEGSTFPWGQQFFARWTYRGPGLDLGLYAASVLDQAGAYELPKLTDLYFDDKVLIGVHHPRYELVGNSGALLYDAFLLKWELLYATGKAFMTGDPTIFPPVLDVMEADCLQGMIGLSYTGVQDLTITLESQKTLVLDTLPSSPFDPESPTFGANLRYTTLRERLQLVLAAMVMGSKAELGWLGSAYAIYELRDDLKFKLGGITYQPGDDFGPFYGLTTHDRVFAQLRWDFLFP